MPFREMSRLEERVVMVRAYESGLFSVSDIAARHGVSRETVYYWVRRKAAGGERWFSDVSRAPHVRPQAYEEEIVNAVVAMRRRFPSFGPKKVVAKLAIDRPELNWPSASTAGLWLSKAGLLVATSRRRRSLPQASQQAEVGCANDEWAMDFKGWFRTSSGERCDPLTVTDTASRYLLATRIVPPTHLAVKTALEELFCQVGLPQSLRSDNGSPFGSVGAGGLSRLSVWLLKLGVEPHHIRPGKPQDNGRHERMHRTLKAETTKPAALNRTEQQQRFDRFRHYYNQERPHEALGQQPPASQWQPSLRPYRAAGDEPWYDADHEVRRVRPAGDIKWRGKTIFIGEALAGELIGLKEREQGGHTVCFATRELGVLTPNQRFLRYARPIWRPSIAAEHNNK